MKHDSSNRWSTQFRKRASPSSFAIFLAFLFFVQLISTFHGENHKLLELLKKIIVPESEPTDVARERRRGINPVAISNNNSPPNHHAILMIHYHKTGFVLSRHLRSHSIKQLNQYISDERLPSSLNFTIPQDKSWGSIQQPRKFGETHCPDYFRLNRGVINVQESPDFYCSVDEMAKILLDDQYGNETHSREGTKIVHFVRNPYSMVLSNYYYHAQVPTPEPWVNRHNPCQLEYDNDNTTLRDLFFPTLSDRSILSKESFDKILDVCNSLYQTRPDLKKEHFKGHLHNLDPIDGLKLSTAQMMIRGGGVMLMPGGDLLRMANNIIKLKQLQEYLEKNGSTSYKPFIVVALSMDDFITNPVEFTTTYLKILAGDQKLLLEDKPSQGNAMMKVIANRFARNYNKMKNKEEHKHVTTGKHDDQKELIESLKNDEVFGPVLDAIERLVNDALYERKSAGW